MPRKTLLLLLLLLPAAGAAEPFSVPPEAVDPRAPVLLDGHEVLRVGGVSALPASRRAAEIGRRLEVLVEDPGFEAGSLELRESTIGL